MDMNDIIAEAEREEQENYQQYFAAFEAYVVAAASAPPLRPTRSNRRYIPHDQKDQIAAVSGRLVSAPFLHVKTVVYAYCQYIVRPC